MQLDSCFKAYDIRGKVPEELNVDLAYRIGRAYAVVFQPKKIVVGRDVRLSSAELSEALIEGLLSSGVDILDIGVSGTELVYYGAFAWKNKNVDGGIMVTASHNPKEYNGFKLVGREAFPVHQGNGLKQIQQLSKDVLLKYEGRRGKYEKLDIISEYVNYLMEFTGAPHRSLHVVTNAGNGGAGRVLSALGERLPFYFTPIQHEPDGNFPNGVPNPLLPEHRKSTSDEIKKVKADFGVAFDGDFDRCFFFDEEGNFIESYYIVGLLADFFLRKAPGAKIVYEPRVIWNTVDIIKELKGVPVLSRTGHAFMKEKMKLSNAVYGGEMSGHHYFRDFGYCDSGMLPWLIIANTLASLPQPLSELVNTRKRKYPISGEINFTTQKPLNDISNELEKRYANHILRIAEEDGKSFEFEDWRFNIRMSNTESFLRLNVESKEGAFWEEKTSQLISFIEKILD